MAAKADADSPRRIRPGRMVVDAILRAVPQLRPAVEKLAWRVFYEVVAIRGGEHTTTFVNYGFAGPEETADNADDSRFGLALYAAVAGAGNIAGKDVLEVGCGRGEGSAYVFERFRPRSLTGVDLARAAIRHCRRKHGRPGLTFIGGDAEKLPFPDARFDVVLNVESSHCYPHMSVFLGEVHRVLKPGGLMLYADFRPTAPTPAGEVAKDDIGELLRQIEGAGLRIVEEVDITAEVLRALSLSTPTVLAHIERDTPRAFRQQSIDYSGVEGSLRFGEFEDGTLTYRRFVLEKT
ncbi:MAG TPA: methyltransferase domain-containing protein [Solirubrobacteraceae bacterium]|nr:methyltransferase domain-containing protein [Solirubrobacteraceae bacterium]